MTAPIRGDGVRECAPPWFRCLVGTWGAGAELALRVWAVQGYPAQLVELQTSAKGWCFSGTISSEGGMCLFLEAGRRERRRPQGLLTCLPRLPSRPGSQGYLTEPLVHHHPNSHQGGPLSGDLCFSPKSLKSSAPVSVEWKWTALFCSHLRPSAGPCITVSSNPPLSALFPCGICLSPVPFCLSSSVLFLPPCLSHAFFLLQSTELFAF